MADEHKGKKNLRPMNTRTKAEQSEIAKKGGKASGEARRKKKQLSELLEIALSQLSENGKDDNYTVMTAAIVKKAMGGDTKAYEVIRDTIGQKPTDKLEAEMKGDIDINISVGE